MGENRGMSMLGGHGAGADVGETVASLSEYPSAQKVVSKLIAGEVPAKDISIVGMGLRTVERVTGRLGFGAAARSGAVNGVLIGLFFGAVVVLTNPEAPIQLFAGFLFIGVALGMCMGLVSYAIVRRRRDYASVTQIAADSYEVRVQPASLAHARPGGGAARPAPARAPVNLEEPPRYGERIPAADADGAAPGDDRAAPDATEVVSATAETRTAHDASAAQDASHASPKVPPPQ